MSIHVLIRPGLQEFLNRMSQIYELVSFTASVSTVPFFTIICSMPTLY